ncbi:YcaO-like family protein [Sulfurivirga sp.]|uniref:YcaO-like family protein n=1 Tax=Sulfurivirga sp. TaxID=2614236 RepID=UPI0025FD1139|nr:YcaO-like family protein [Sulfurivirga sp.]
MKHYLTGKAVALEEALERMEAILDRLGFHLEECGWLNPAPHIWSVHVRACECPLLFSNGKGISREAALASAFGEFLERLLTGYFYGDWALPCDRLRYAFVPDEKTVSSSEAVAALPALLRAQWGLDEVAEAQLLPSLACCGEQVRVLPLQPLVGADEPIEVPWNVLMNFYGSNGLCAGSTHLEARIQGASEIFERWARRRILEENLCLPEVPEAVIAASERVLAAREALEREGVVLSIRDASLGLGVPVVAIILYQQGSGRAFVSFGAHPIFEVALERTLTEAFQGRRLGELDGYQPPSDDADWTASWENQEAHFIDASGQFHWHFFSDRPDFDFTPWGVPADADFARQWDYLADCFERLEQPVWEAVYERDGFYACRLIAPGMSEVFPPDELLENNQNGGCVLRRHLQAFRTEADWNETLLELLDAYGWADHLSVGSVIGVAFEADSPWLGLKMLDLRLRALMALEAWDEVMPLLEEARYLAADRPEQAGAWTLLAQALETGDLAPLSQAATALYGRETVVQVERWLAGEAWADLPMGEALIGPLHRSLWATHPGRCQNA